MNPTVHGKKWLGNNFQIEKIRVWELTKLSNEFGYATVTMRDKEGQKFTQSLNYNTGDPHNEPKPEREHGQTSKPPHAVNIDDIIKQKDNIEKYVEEAVNQINEELEGKYNPKSVTDLQFTANDNGELQIRFSVNVTEKGKEPRQEGRRTVTDYYELEFSVDDDGNVIFEDD
jgi:hypothetical protein